MDVPALTPDEARAAIAAGAPLLDVREQDEWDQVRVEGARLLPLSELGDRLDEVPRGAQVVVMCRSGVRSAQVVEALHEQLGWSGYVNLAGGILAWHAAGLPVEPAGAVPH
jgi:rhodanese-related sulfurtransferase